MLKAMSQTLRHVYYYFLFYFKLQKHMDFGEILLTTSSATSSNKSDLEFFHNFNAF